MKSTLILEDGSVFEGECFAGEGTKCGPVVFYTGVVGYQEVITDPANAGKIVVMTYPLIGNYGVNQKFNESARSCVSGIVLKELSKIQSNWQSEDSLDNFTQKRDMIGLKNVDTRTLTVNLRDNGERWGFISSKTIKSKKALKFIKEGKNKEKTLLPDISSDHLECVNSGSQKIVILDIGMRKSFIEQLKKLGCELWLAPFNTPASEILKMKPDGVIVSSGPEDDPKISDVVNSVKELMGKVKILGLVAGHEIIARAIGAKIDKLKIGHHGVNYPVLSKESQRGHITVQNNSYTVNEDSLKDAEGGIEVLERNLNDNTVAKMKSETLNFISAQYYPVSPGFDEPHNLFKDFLASKHTAVNRQ